MLRSILAVIAGSIVWTVLWLGTNAVFMQLFPQWYGEGGRIESAPVLLFVIIRSLLFSIVAGYVTALIAQRSELKHAFALGVLQLAMGILATVQFFDLLPLWYHIAFLVLLIPGNLLGGYLRVMQSR